MSKQYKAGFNFLKLFLDKKYGVKVVQISGAEDAWYPAIKKIIINNDLQWRERLLALIHESGHVQIDLEASTVKNMKCTGTFSDCTDSNNIKSKKHLVNVLNEELMAWNLGKNLAVNLNIQFDNHRLEEITTRCIMSYVKYGLKKVYGKKINVEVIDPRT
tara:strand:+ start:1256 stop:1735 length:480 start_codon:yes stop_codon:yes gene_type:complete